MRKAPTHRFNPITQKREAVNHRSWTPEEHAQVAQLWLSGWSAREIGKKFGVSKAAIDGKIDRLGLKRAQS